MGIGSVTFSLPHFLTGPYRVRGSEGLNATLDNICKAPSLLDQADRDTYLQNIPGLQKIKSLVNSEGKKLGRGCFIGKKESRKVGNSKVLKSNDRNLVVLFVMT